MMDSDDDVDGDADEIHLTKKKNIMLAPGTAAENAVHII